jgi:hypothetical protein
VIGGPAGGVGRNAALIVASRLIVRAIPSG